MEGPVPEPQRILVPDGELDERVLEKGLETEVCLDSTTRTKVMSTDAPA